MQANVSSPKALDRQWFTKISPYITELFLVLGPLHAEILAYRTKFERKAFVPDMRPKHLDPSALERTNIELGQLKAEISRYEPNEYVRRAYILKIDELVLQNNLLLSSLQNDRAAFMQANRLLYGSPDALVFAGACAWVRQVATESVNGEDQAAIATLESLPNIGGAHTNILPLNDTFTTVRNAHWQTHGFYEQLLGSAKIPDFVTPEIGDRITKEAIHSVGSDYILADSTDELWGVVHDAKHVVRPPDYHLAREEFIGIIAHEIGSHLAEKVNGLRQPLLLLSAGMDKYEASNEGRAFIREQIVYRSPYEMLQQPSWEYIVLLYLAAALGAGVYQHEYNFIELFNTLYPVCLLFQSKRQPDNPVYAQVKAYEETWQLVVRATKGTDGNGGAYLKALVYLDGNVRAWQTARKHPEMIVFGDQGKFDIGRTDHLAILAALGIAPQ